MANTTTATCLPLFPSLEMAWRDVDSSFERFCLTAGIGAVEQMLRQDAQQLTGAPHSRGGGRAGHRWGTTEGKIGFHGGKVTVHRPRVRSFDGHEVALPSWTAAQAEDWLEVKYKDGEKTIVVPSDAEVVNLVAGGKADLKTGAHVFIPRWEKQGDGTWQATVVVVGRDGITPPM